ncbi:exonuclease domain-containing protein [Spongiivirga citrea]|uniref:Exonuclease n=1 Tax=Spongiivirga citrea TaxID=1481457 RepID=A0A6M0CI07_9FLAO|nr:exonuclease domain-containing protein [Spongiivirga citrea]NER17596.1 exonuclease [Spongiivirga citrea]
MYAILDIETTGGKFNEEGTTEVAIYRFDGHKVVDQFISLVNPEKEIQPFVVNLTGINNNMLKSAPKFYEVAKRIVEITEDCVIVAHNAEFDYRVLRNEFNRLGFDFQRKTLCTVELAQHLIPDQPSYSLGKLVRTLGIPMSDRHRASGDAMATVKLFKLLLAKDIEKNIIQQSIQSGITTVLPSKLLDIVEDIPSETGILYIHDKAGSIIYIEHSRNLKRKVNQHFTGQKEISKRIQKLVASVTYALTGNELIAQLKAYEEINTNRPSLNKNVKPIFRTALYKQSTVDGYIHLSIDKPDKRKQEISTFTSYAQARAVLIKLSEKFELCASVNRLIPRGKYCVEENIVYCKGTCEQKETPDTYNQRVEALIQYQQFDHQTMAFIDRGREVDERSVILIENGKYAGYGFYNLNFQLNNLSVLKTIITPAKDSIEARHLIKAYSRKKKGLKVIEL